MECKEKVEFNMKHLTYIAITFVITTGLLSTDRQNFSVLIEPMWENLEHNPTRNEQFGGKWILVGSITFRKRCKDPVCLQQIRFHWQGKEINHLIGSLYKKNPDREFMPIQENLICDGLWNKPKQILVLNFDKKQSLGPTTIFYLVLTIPKNVESILQNGSFYIEKRCLPEPFKSYAHTTELSLALNTSPSTQPIQ